MNGTLRTTLAGKRLLVTGASGFLGKVWLAHLLEELPELERVWVLLRPGARGARARLEELLATSPAFWPLHERHGPALGRVLGAVLEALPGDVGRPGLGLDPTALDALAGRVDLIVHLAGLTDLEPDLERALAANVDGALHALEVARATGAGLLHVSTAYVAGRRRGVVPERLEPDYVPPGGGRAGAFSARQEVADLRRVVERVRAEADDQRTRDELLRRAVDQLRRHGRADEPAARAEFLARIRSRWISARLEAEGRARAAHWGWPNAYTLTKSLAESLLLEAAGDTPLAVVRPAIVESAAAFPFPGWKEGHQTSAPLVWAMARGPLRGLPASRRLRLDVVPVDWVARALTLTAAALLRGHAPPVVQVGTGATNPLTMERAIELTNLAARAERAPRPGPRAFLRELATPDAEPVGDLGYRLGSVPMLRRLSDGAGELLGAAAELLPGRLAGRARDLARQAERTTRRLGDLERTVATFRPFVLENDVVFETGALGALAAELGPGEREAFGVDLGALDWRRYWVDVHLPGLRRWVFPRLEGRRGERLARRPVRLEAPVAPPAAAAPADVEAGL